MLMTTDPGDLVLDPTCGSGTFGEPDIVVKTEGDEVTVELLGVDVYDPTTGDVRSGGTDQVACG